MLLEEKYLNTLCVSFAKDFDISLSALSKKLRFKIDKSNLVEHLENFDQVIDYYKRKETGSYYTPKYIGEYMVKSAIIEYFLKNSSMSYKRLTSIFYEKKYNVDEDEFYLLINTFKKIKIIDIASGTGVFLVKYFEIIKSIIDANSYPYEKGLIKDIACKIYAVDINPIALNIIQLKMNRIYQLNSLDDFLEIQTFNINSITNEAFYNRLPVCSFDIVIGNPPYIGEKGNKDLFNDIKASSFGKKYYEGRMDIFYYFIYRGIHLLNNQGILIYLTTNYFVTADGANKLRLYLKNQGYFNRIIDFGNHQIFKDALGQHNLIFSYQKKSDDKKSLITKLDKHDCIDDFHTLVKAVHKGDSSYKVDHHGLFDDRNNIQLLENVNHDEIIKKIEDQSAAFLKDYFHVNQGIVSGADKVSNYHLNKKLSDKIIMKYQVKKDQGIFIINDDEIGAFKDKHYLKKLYKNSNINKFSVTEETSQYILYIDNEVALDSTLRKHLLPYKEILDQRREVKNGIRPWYALQWPRKKEIFKKEKIVLPQRSYNNTFAYSNKDFYASADVYYITKKDSDFDYSLKLLLGLLNSKLYYLYLYNVGKKKGKMLELYATPIKHIKIPKLMSFDHIEVTIDRLIEGYNSKDFESLNQWVYRMFNLDQRMIDLVESFYSKYNKKL